MNPPNLKNQKGQLIVEAVLLMVVLFGITMAVSKYFASEQTLKALVSGPWQNLAGMIQNGSWGTPAATFALHPNAHARHISINSGEP